MNNYTFNSPNFHQLLEKYLFYCDNKITSIINYKNFVNPDYLILNHSYKLGDQPFYSNEELGLSSNPEDTLEILTQVNDNTYVHVYKLRPHQGIVNNFGDHTYIIYSAEQWADESQRNLYKLEQGFVVISNAAVEYNYHTDTAQLLDSEHNAIYTSDDLEHYLSTINVLTQPDLIKTNPDNYLIHALGASGTFYVPQSWSPSSTWIYTPNATDIYGTYSYITLAPNRVRWRWWNAQEISGIGTYFLQPAINTSTAITSVTSITRPEIQSASNSVWQTSYRLDYELLNEDLEEIICADTSDSYTQVNFDKTVLNIYIINTDIPSKTITMYVNYY